jgi:AsmA family protein
LFARACRRIAVLDCGRSNTPHWRASEARVSVLSQRRGRPRILRAILSFSFFVVLGAVAVIAVVLLEWRHVVPAVVTHTTGRELVIHGNSAARFLSWRPRMILEDVTFSNAPWSRDKQMLEVGRFEIALSVRRLLRGDVVFPKLQIDDARIRLEAKQDGTNNWTFGPTEAAKPDDRTEVPAFRHLRIRNTHLTYFRHGAPESGIDLQLAAANGTVARTVLVKANGRYQKADAKLTLEAGSIAALHDEDTPYPLDVAINAGDTAATIAGHLRGPLDEGGLDVQMTLQGKTLSELYPLIGVVLPSSPPYRLKGRLEHEGDNWRYTKFDGKLGDSDLSGDVNVAVRRPRPLMTAELRSKLLDFDDLAGLIGAPPKTGPGETANAEQKADAAEKARSGLVLPDKPLDIPRLNAMDIDAHLVAERVKSPSEHFPVDRLDFKFLLTDGTLKAAPAAFDIASGHVDLYATVFADRAPARVETDIKARGLRIARIIGDTPFTDETRGSLGGEIKLAMRGMSLKDMATTADGTARLAMADAQVSHLLMEIAGLDVMESLGVAVSGDEALPVRCAAFDFTATDGLVRSNLFVIDTDDTNITADATLDLKTEKLDLAIHPHPKDISLLSLKQRLRVEGRLSDLDVYPDPLKLGPVGDTMQKVNFVLAPIVGLLTPFDLRMAKDDNGCQAFLNEHNGGSAKNMTVTSVRSGNVRKTGESSSASSKERQVTSDDRSTRSKLKSAVKNLFTRDKDEVEPKATATAKKPATSTRAHTPKLASSKSKIQ